MKAITCNAAMFAALAMFVLTTFTATEATPSAGTVITSSVSTTLMESSPNSPHGLDAVFIVDENHSGGPSHALLKMNIPEDVLNDFYLTPNAVALLELSVTDKGDWVEMYRMRDPWAPNYMTLTWNNFSDGNGVVPGSGVSRTRSAIFLPKTDVITVDVTADVMKWATGIDNDGWSLVPTDSGGSDFASINNVDSSKHPRLTLGQIVQEADRDVLIPRNSTWRYLEDITTGTYHYPHDGDNNLWYSTDLDEADTRHGTWKTGDGVFGNGVLGTINTPLDREQSTGVNRPTFLFRKEFAVSAEQLADPEFLELHLLSDDGCAVYINDVLVFERDLPGNINNLAWDHSDYADQTTYDEGENYIDYLLNMGDFPGLLHEGTNLVAVEVHNRDANSSDIGFDLEMSLTGTGVLGDLNPIPEPSTALLALLGLLGLLPVIRRK